MEGGSQLQNPFLGSEACEVLCAESAALLFLPVGWDPQPSWHHRINFLLQLKTVEELGFGFFFRDVSNDDSTTPFIKKTHSRTPPKVCQGCGAAFSVVLFQPKGNFFFFFFSFQERAAMLVTWRR